jgi:DNA-binding transcriptional LysR family regulator
MMDFNPTDLRYFFEAARSLNLSRAAERLGVGQPTVSQAIKRLESSFGTSLFDRYKTGVRLTSAGKRLYSSGRTAIEHLERLKEEVLSSEVAIEGSYSIGCHVSVGLYALPAFLKTVMIENPRLEVRLSHGLSREVTEDVISFRTDFGIVVNPSRHPDLVIKELCRDQIGYWAVVGADTQTLIFDPSLSQCQAILSKTNPKLLSFSRRLESSSLEIIASLAETGCGVALLPERVAHRFSKLKIFRVGLPRHEDKICLVFRSDRKTSASARLIIDKIFGTKF